MSGPPHPGDREKILFEPRPKKPEPTFHEILDGYKGSLFHGLL